MRKLFFPILFLAVANTSWATEGLSTIGTPSAGSSLYACSTSSINNPNPHDGRSRIYTTSCRKVANPDIDTNPQNAHKYSPGASMTDVDSAFFWYRRDDQVGGSDSLSAVCNDYIDHFKSCDWTKLKDDIQVEQQTFDGAETLVKDILKLPTEDLTKPGVYGCAVMLCLANPNGWRSVKECHPPIRKLFRDLAKGRGFPHCSM